MSTFPSQVPAATHRGVQSDPKSGLLNTDLTPQLVDPERGSQSSGPAQAESQLSTRMKLLLSAGPIFAQRGYRKATIREICERANVNLASVNYHFGDKQTLYQQTVLLAREMREQQVPNPEWDQSTRPEDKLRQFVELILRRLVVNDEAPWQVHLLMNEIQRPTRLCEQLVTDYFRPFMDNLIAVVQEVADRPLHRSVAARLAMSIVGQCMIYRFAPQTLTMTLGNVLADHPPGSSPSPTRSDQGASLVPTVLPRSRSKMPHGAVTVGEPGPNQRPAEQCDEAKCNAHQLETLTSMITRFSLAGILAVSAAERTISNPSTNNSNASQ